MQVETVSLLLLDGRLIPGMLLHHAVLAPRASKPTRAFRFGTVQQLQARCGAGAFQNMLDHAASSSRRGPAGDDSTGPRRWCLTQGVGVGISTGRLTSEALHARWQRATSATDPALLADEMPGQVGSGPRQRPECLASTDDRQRGLSSVSAGGPMRRDAAMPRADRTCRRPRLPARLPMRSHGSVAKIRCPPLRRLPLYRSR
jgi:hypothetical protein